MLAHPQGCPSCCPRMFTRLSEMSDSHILVIVVPYVLEESNPHETRAKIRVEFAFISCRMYSASTRLKELKEA